MIDDAALAAFAETHAASAAAVRGLVDSVAAAAGATRLYVFWVGGGAGTGGGAETRRERTLVAFPSPDAALAFAQRNQLAGAAARPRLRQLSLLQLFHAMLNEPAIVCLLLADDTDHAAPPSGRLPAGLRIERAELLRRLAL